MAYFDLTTTEQILAVLTVDDSDLEAATVEAQNLDDDLGIALDKALPNVDWEDLVTTGTPKQARLLRLVAKYFCAGTVAGMAQVFVLKKVTDGSNEGQRSDKDGWAFMSDTLLGKANGYLSDLIDDLQLTPAVGMNFTLFSRVIPERDPITTPRSTTT
jgi:hypothetical protein